LEGFTHSAFRKCSKAGCQPLESGSRASVDPPRPVSPETGPESFSRDLWDPMGDVWRDQAGEDPSLRPSRPSATHAAKTVGCRAVVPIAIEPGFGVVPCCPDPPDVQGCHPEPGNTRRRLEALRPLVPSLKPLAPALPHLLPTTYHLLDTNRLSFQQHSRI